MLTDYCIGRKFEFRILIFTGSLVVTFGILQFLADVWTKPIIINSHAP